jgi:hypothetical protein
VARLTDVVGGGDLRASLEALRDHLASEIEGGVLCKACGGPASSPTAPLAKQLSDVLKALDALPSVEEKSIADELADRRAARNEGAQASKRSSGQKRAGGARHRSGGSRRAGS